MKIGFLTSEFPHPRIGVSGGIGTSIMNLAKGLEALGNEVLVFVYGQNEDEVFVENNITYYRIKNIKIKGLSRYLTQKKIEKLLNSLVKNQALDVVEAADWTGITSFINCDCPLIIKLHGSDTYFCHLDNRPVKAINRFHEKRALQNADALLSVSSYTAALTTELFDLKRPFTTIHNSIDLSKFENSEAGIDTNEPVILYFGTLIRKKGLLEMPLIFNKVFEQHPKARLVLVGRDTGDAITGNKSTWEMMQPLFNPAAFKNVTYSGSVPYDQIKNEIHRASVCIFPTVAEALPVSWIEAMAMKKAIVASDIGWAKEVIDDEKDGFLAHPKNHVLFADRIITLLQNKELRTAFGLAAAQKAAGKFSIHTIAKQNLEFYNKLIENEEGIKKSHQ